MIYFLAAVVLAFCIGHWVAGRMEAAYWAAHGEDGGSVFHRGKFYLVNLESAEWDRRVASFKAGVEAAAVMFDNRARDIETTFPDHATRWPGHVDDTREIAEDIRTLL